MVDPNHCYSGMGGEQEADVRGCKYQQLFLPLSLSVYLPISRQEGIQCLAPNLLHFCSTTNWEKGRGGLSKIMNEHEQVTARLLRV